jgi:hypothetical protein
VTNPLMREPAIRAVGLAGVAIYAAVIASLFVSQPKTMTEAVGGLTSTIGVYAIDAQAFADGLVFFRKDQFVEARAAFARADPALQDARTQFYIAYSYYRQGWHRTHSDDALYREGVKSTERAIALAPGGRFVVDDNTLQMRTADELLAELNAGLTTDVSDFNPLRLLGERK